MTNVINFLRTFPKEAILWTAGFVALFIADPTVQHFTLCPLKNLGFDFCPGCGLGTSVSHLLHGELRQSWQAHPLGIFAVIVLSLRIIKLSKQHIQSHGKNC